MIFQYIAVFGACFCVSFAGTWYVRRIANRRGWAQAPASGRHIHSTPIPRLGGVAIFAGCVSVLGGAALLGPLLGFQLPWHALAMIAIPTGLVFAIGLYDDFRGVPALVKFGAQAVAACMLFSAGLRVTSFSAIFGGVHFGTAVSLIATIFWVVLITNAFNLIDGLDGLAAGSGLFSILVVSVVAMATQDVAVATVGFALGGATLGFLRFNFHPATIFLGDCGSLLIGFLLSAIALLGSQKSPTVVAVAIPIVSFGFPILDTILAIVRRFLSGKPIFGADRDHIHHKLIERGLSHRGAVLLLYGVSALFGVVSLILLHANAARIAVALVVVGAIVWVGVQQLGYHEIGELQRIARRTLQQKQVILNNLPIRRAVVQMNACSDFESLCSILGVAARDSGFDAFDLNVFKSAASLGSFAWNKSEQDVRSHGQMAWRVGLSFTSSSGQLQGEFCCYRKYTGKDMLIDMNLMTIDLLSAFTRVADRMEKQAGKTIPLFGRTAATAN